MEKQQFADPGKAGRAAAGLPVVPAIDGFRALAIFGVVLIHILLFSGAAVTIAGTFLGDASLILPLGVTVLFAVSGFVLFLPVAATGEFGSVGAYALRRAARIFPAYWLSILIVAVAIAIVPPYAGVFAVTPGAYVELPSLWEFFAHITFLQTPVQQIDVHFDRGLAINGPLWTLSVEIGFYLVLPFIAAWWNRHPFWGLGISAVIATGWHLAFGRMGGILTRLGFDPDPEWFQLFVLAGDYQLPAFAFAFGVGMTAAWLFVRLRTPAYGDRIGRWARLGLPAALVAVAVAVYLANRYGVNPNTLGGAPAIGRVAPFTSLLFELSIGLLMLSACFAPAWQSWVFGNRGMVWLADHSYGVYLIHYPILAYVLLVFEPLRDGSLEAFAIWCALTLPPAILYGWASARWFEQPIRRWARRYGRRTGIAEAGSAPAGGGPRT